MKKNGFTIIEIITVLTILGLIGIILVPRITSSFDKTKTEQLESVRNNISNAADVFLESSCGKKQKETLNNNNSIKIYLKNIVDCGILDDKIYNPNTNNYLDINKEYIEINIDDVGLKSYRLSF